MIYAYDYVMFQSNDLFWLTQWRIADYIVLLLLYLYEVSYAIRLWCW